ncbi:MAG: 3-hydroxyacyl-ACP dehydratase FabZ, partial [Chitinispirillaceae bacterium]|nr:3-hydroxyacyl-ACP dehydratase FabZ [Chitinispirillaceae bacterium]
EHIDYIRRLFAYKGPITAGSNGFLNNTQLRFYNEPCRHKALDLIGDFYLLGKPINAHIIGARTGHAANIAGAKKVREQLKALEQSKKAPSINTTKPKIQLSYEEIMEILPHRYPFLLVDSVLELIPGEYICACKNVSFNEAFFEGHFPGNPTMPGVLQIEAMAQAGAIMGLYGKKSDKKPTVLFLGIDKARFRGIVRPGDVLRMEVKMLKFRRGTGVFEGKCYVGDKLVCEAELLAMMER